jgi:hypothetical protein
MGVQGRFERPRASGQAQERHVTSKRAKEGLPVIADLPGEKVSSDADQLWITREQARAMLQVSMTRFDKLSHEPGFPVAIRGHRMVRFVREAFIAWAKEYGRRQLEVAQAAAMPRGRRRK